MAKLYAEKEKNTNIKKMLRNVDYWTHRYSIK